MSKPDSLLALARTLLEEIERNLAQIQDGQLLYYKQILMYTLYALGHAVDALVLSKLNVKPSGHGDRLLYLTQLGREDIRQLYEKLIVLVFSKLETVASLKVQDLRYVVDRVKSVINSIAKEIYQHV